jgi:hypothetical protein
MTWLVSTLDGQPLLRTNTLALALFVHTRAPAVQVGLRGYNATRQLLLAGLDAVNVSGGYRSWLQAKL